MISNTSAIGPFQQFLSPYLTNSAPGPSAAPAAPGALSTQVELMANHLEDLRARQVDAGASQALTGQLAASLNSLGLQLGALQAPNALVQHSATSSNIGVVDATASAWAQEGSFQLRVDKLATSQLSVSAGKASATATGLLGSGSLQIQAAGQAARTYTIDSSTTLTSLAQAITANGNGVAAAVQANGDGTFSLAVSGTQTGAAQTLSVSESGSTVNVSSTPARAAADASYQLDGRALHAANNLITDAVPGLSLQLLSASATAATITVAVDASPLLPAILGVVGALNQAQASLAAAQQPSPRGTPPSNMLQVVGSVLSDGMAYRDPLATGTYRSLADLGITQAKDGSVGIDSAMLAGALNTDPVGVASLLGGSGHGLAASLGPKVRQLGKPIAGLLPLGMAAMRRPQQRANPLDDADASPAAYQLSVYQNLQRTRYGQQQAQLAGLMVRGMYF